MRFLHTTALVASLCAVAACGKSNDQKNDPLAQDPSLAHDLDLANHDTTAQPQLKDVATTPPPAPRVTQPSAPAPAPRPRTTRPSTVAQTPPPPPPPAAAPTPATTPSGNTVEHRAAGNGSSEGRVGTVSAGTSLSVTAGQKVCTNTNNVGDRFTATLADPIIASNGVTIPAGATAVFEITSLKRSESSGDKSQIGAVLRSIAYAGKTYPVNGEITSAATETMRAADNNDATKVLGGAAVGAVLGRIFSGKSKTKGTVIGAAGGAAAGAVLAAKTGKYDACIPSGGRITVRLNSAMQIQSVGSDNTPSNSSDNGSNGPI